MNWDDRSESEEEETNKKGVGLEQGYVLIN